ncbi:MAG: molybdopterin-binding protein [Acidimicrobiales bacterium]
MPDSRRTAVAALVRIERDGAYANLVLPPLLARSGLSERDRAFATELVYGTTRHRRACDWFVDRFAFGDLDPTVRAALRVGAYQLKVLDTPAHAAVSATVDTVPRRARGLVNAVLRKVATAEDAWPSDAVRLSYPDWLVERLEADLGPVDAQGALVSMNGAATVTERADGYIQDRASQWVAEAVGAGPGELVLDLCAAPGGKATALAAEVGADGLVVAADVRPGRIGLVAGNARRLDSARDRTVRLAMVAADGAHPPFPPGSFDRVLVDAPCSGLGSLRRRPDARWRIDAAAPERLADLQHRLLAAAADLVRPGGWLVYSVCTMTVAETTGVAERFAAGHPGWTPSAEPPTGGAWRRWGTGALLLPQDAGTDGMAVFIWQAPGHGGAPTAVGPIVSGTAGPEEPAEAPAPSGGTNVPVDPNPERWRARVVVVSDGVADGSRQDRGGPALRDALEGAGATVEAVVVSPDGIEAVADTLRAQVAGFAGLVVTTGGTGFGPRDLTPEGTRRVIDREAPGLAEAMRLTNPLGRLSRGTAGSLGAALVLNVPGSPKGAVECLEAVVDVVPHALALLAGDRPH